jgi:hypothetical protein
VPVYIAISVIRIRIFNILDSLLKFLGKKKRLAFQNMDTDPDPPKLCRSDRIRIHTTACLISYFSPMYCYNSSSVAGGEIPVEDPQLGARGQRDIPLLRTERTQLLHGHCGGPRL